MIIIQTSIELKHNCHLVQMFVQRFRNLTTCYYEYMSHLYGLSELKKHCDTTGQCAEYGFQLQQKLRLYYG